jgi:predicted amidophosphoribosyltransferase
MRFSTCRTCGRHIDATARICPECGALTGVNRAARDEPVVSPVSFVAALVVGLVALLVLRWLGILL